MSNPNVVTLAHRLATRVLLCPCLGSNCVTCKLDTEAIRASGAIPQLLQMDPSLYTDLGLTADPAPVPEGGSRGQVP